MDWNAYVRAELGRRGSAPDADVVEELAQHALASYDAARADGLSVEDAQARVRALVDAWCAESPRHRSRRLNRPPVVEPPAADSRGWTGFSQDVRYGARLLRRQPGFAALAILIVALGIGAATTIGNLTYVVLLKPLAWPGADRLVTLSEQRDGATRQYPNIISNATYLAWRDAPETIEGIASWGLHTSTLTTGGGDPERLTYVSTTASLFPLLQATPMLGSLFTADDEPADRSHVIVVGYSLWQRRFGGRPDAVGRTLELNAEPYRVVAVMPRDFAFPSAETQAWVPGNVPPVLGKDPNIRSASLSRGLARLKPGVTADQASAEGTARGRSAPDLGMVGTAMFGTQGKPRITATPYFEWLTADVRPALSILMTAVLLLLAVGVANIASMQLARTTARRREMAVRAALGAGAVRLARQLLTESLAIGLAGGAAGWLLSVGLHRALPFLLPKDFPRLDQVAADWRLLTVAMLAGAAASVAFGVLPVLLSRRVNLVEVLAEDSLAPVGSGLRTRVGRMRAVIMTGEVAVAAILLVGALLLGRSFLALMHVDRGYEPRNLVTAVLPTGILRSSGIQRVQLLDTLIARLSQIPGVTHAAASSVIPLLPYDETMGFNMASADGRGQVPVRASMRWVSPDYFAAMGMQISKGRGLSEEDTLASQPVAVVNQTFVRAYLSHDPLGVELPIGDLEHGRGQHAIVGVVNDVRQQGATDPPQPEIFVSYRQAAAGIRVSSPVVLVRTSGDPAALVPTVRRLVREQNGSLVLESVMTMDERLGDSLARPRLYAALLAVFALFALLVAGAGLFGVLSYGVAQRSREIGIRAALGARPARIASLVIRQGLVMTVAGVTLGLGAAFLLVRFVGSLLYGVTAHDPLSFLAVSVALVVVAALACLAPALRAARIDPLTAIRTR